jgi:NTE family protein
VLALRGGGAHGSYEAGALKAFVENLSPYEYAYDIVSGVSVGSINGAILALHEVGDEKRAVEELLDLYMNNPFSSYWSYWPYIFVEPFVKKSFVNSEKFNEFVDKFLEGRDFKRMLSIQSVDLKSGKIVLFDETVPEAIRAKSIISSASIPFVFPPIEIDDYALVDGGTFMNIDIGDPIERCREKGFADADIIVDVLMCMGVSPKLSEILMSQTDWFNAFSIYKRR